MRPHAANPHETKAIRRAVGTRARRWLVAITLLLGALAAVAVSVDMKPADRTFAALCLPVQSLMSVTVPLMGILLAHDLKRSAQRAGALPTLLAATLLAALIGVFGSVVCAAVLAFVPSGIAPHAWDDVATIAVGGVLVQVVAQLVGTGLGLLLRWRAVAFVASIVLPLGLWFVLGAFDALRPAQPWLTPYSTVQNLLSGRMGAQEWVQWFVVLLLWGLGLNAVGVARLKRTGS